MGEGLRFGEQVGGDLQRDEAIGERALLGEVNAAKGTAALLVPVANYMQQSSGSWDRVFLIAAGANILASLLALVVLKPWRRTVVAKSQVS